MRVVVAVNRVSELGPRQTTSMLLASLVQAGYVTSVADVDRFALDGGTHAPVLGVTAAPLPCSLRDSDEIAVWSRTGPAMETLSLQAGDLILLRTNPGRDLARAAIHDNLLDLCRIGQRFGIRVLNDPSQVRLFASKASLALLPDDCRPAMRVSHDAGAIVEFVRARDRECVVKPLVGSRGADVIRVQPGDADLEDRLVQTFGARGMVAQEFIRAERPGDLRIVVCGGRILEHGGALGGIARLPATGDFRGNIHTGGQAEPARLDASQRRTVELAAELLADHGIWLAGVDLVAERVIEFNVFSTGGLYFACQFAQHSFADQVVAELPGALETA